jgi:hypothetical protein
MEIASPAFLAACWRPSICEVILLAMASPAASSPALLIRLPVLRRSIASFIARSFLASELAAMVADVFVFITVILIYLIQKVVLRRDKSKSDANFFLK